MGDYLGSVALPSMKMRQRKLCQIKQQPRAAPVFNDSSNFGVRMLEKLGWSEGKGLGKREDGMSAPILPKMKQDAEGFGYAGEKDDHWTQHDQDFNQLLKSLNGEETPPVDEIDMAKMKSLEEKSKNSRARVHYKKFTRGKDLSRASEKDLANIFGKKTLDEVKNQKTKVEGTGDKDSNEDKSDSDESNILGLTTIKATMSLQDYFKSKMQEKFGQANQSSVIESESVTEIEETSSKKKSKKSRKSMEADFGETETISVSEKIAEHCEEPIKKKKKKKQSKVEDAEDAQESKVELITSEVEPVQEESSKKKPKKEKRSKIEQEEHSADQVDEKPPTLNKKKSKKEKTEQVEDAVVEISESLPEEPVTKKSKNKKRKRSDDQVDSTELQTTPEEVIVEEPTASDKTGSKKKKKSEITEEVTTEQKVEVEEEITCRVKATGCRRT